MIKFQEKRGVLNLAPGMSRHWDWFLDNAEALYPDDVVLPAMVALAQCPYAHVNYRVEALNSAMTIQTKLVAKKVGCCFMEAIGRWLPPYLSEAYTTSEKVNANNFGQRLTEIVSLIQSDRQSLSAIPSEMAD